MSSPETVAEPRPTGSKLDLIQAAAVATATTSIGAVESKKSSRTIETDVLACGGGCAGSAAALAAARAGAQVLLVEKAPFAGGIITSVGLPYFDGIAHISTNRIVVRGIGLELLAKCGVCAPDAKTVAKHNPTVPNTFEFKLLLVDVNGAHRVFVRRLLSVVSCQKPMFPVRQARSLHNRQRATDN